MYLHRTSPGYSVYDESGYSTPSRIPLNLDINITGGSFTGAPLLGGIETTEITSFVVGEDAVVTLSLLVSSSENLNDGTITDVYQNFEFDFESISVTAEQDAESPQFFVGGGSKTITKSLFVDFQESLSDSLVFIGSPVSASSRASTVGKPCRCCRWSTV